MRCGWLVLGAAALALRLAPVAQAQDSRHAGASVDDVASLRPGEYRWQPELSPSGPVAIVVSLPEQLCFVYRNGIRIGVSTISSGMPGHETPTGVFTILQRDVHHHSSKYDGAPMPYAERLTWSGVALHAGALPGYPSSHGCVHLPLAFSAALFSVAQLGTPVVIASAHEAGATVSPASMVLGQALEDEVAAAVAREPRKPIDFQGEHTSIVVSRADAKADVLVNGAVVASGAVTIDDPSAPLGEHVFILSSQGSRLAWHVVSFRRDAAKGARAGGDPEVVLKRIHGATELLESIEPRLAAGTVLVTTDLPISPDSRGTDRLIMDASTS
jgi:hypothetical protein